MSGGVDSSLTALLLADEGYRVVGFTMILHREGEWDDSVSLLAQRCCGSSDSISRARDAASRAGGEHCSIDARAEFERYVLNDFEREYSLGHTPNPCIRCNTFMKWGFLVEQARQRDIEYIATGHHARITEEGKGDFTLRRAVDSGKDQSYALWGIPRDLLKSTLLPIGEMQKREVRALARRHRLASADMPDSQEICFIPSDNYREYLERRQAESGSVQLTQALTPGDIVNMEGKVVGQHKGVARFTIGQRHGLGISAGRPLFVIHLDPANSTVTVGEEENLWRDGLSAAGTNWVSIDPPAEPFRAEIRIRYNSRPAPALVIPQNQDGFRVEFDEPQKAITPGQSAVIYRDEIVLGGGVILE
jgi:tRNA-specific 2-thiouridylase